MLRECTNCRHVNAPHANYCGRCGQAFPQPGLAEPVARTTTHRGGAGWLLLLVPLFIIFGRGDRRPACTPYFRPGPAVQRAYALAGEKADALFSLLAPRDVRVLVSRCDGGIHVTGTAREIEILDHLAALLTRVQCSSRSCIERYLAEVRPSWTSTRMYELSPHKASGLFRLLAFEDVPLGVSARKSKVRVDANTTDQETVQGLVNILNGKRVP